MVQHFSMRQVQQFYEQCLSKLRESRLFHLIRMLKDTLARWAKGDSCLHPNPNKEIKMSDQDTSTTAATTQDSTAVANTDTQTSTDTSTASTTQTSETPTRTLEQVYEDYEKALTDFDAKLDLATDAKIVALTAAQAVATLKQELDTLEKDVSETFDKVQAYLASA